MSQFISLEKAVAMTTLYRKEKEQILAPDYREKNILARCETFERYVFDTILSNPECKSIRVYYGMDDELKVHAIVVGVNEKGEDILPAEGMNSGEESGIGEEAKRCPVDCPPPSPINP